MPARGTLIACRSHTRHVARWASVTVLSDSQQAQSVHRISRIAPKSEPAGPGLQLCGSRRDSKHIAARQRVRDMRWNEVGRSGGAGDHDSETRSTVHSVYGRRETRGGKHALIECDEGEKTSNSSHTPCTRAAPSK